MSTEGNVRNRVAEFPRSTSRVVAGVLLSVGLGVALRFVSGIFIGGQPHPVTYLALVGGGLGATAMYAFVWRFDDDLRFAPIEFWANVVGDGTTERYRYQGVYLHVTYGALIGAFFPRLMQELNGGGAGGLFATLPLSLVTGGAFGLALFVLGVAYAQLGFFRLELSTDRVGVFLLEHLVYGIVLGLVTGLWLPLLEPVVG